TKHLQSPARAREHLVDVTRRETRRRAQAIADVLVALAENLQVQRQYQRAAAGGLRAIDQLAGKIAVAHDIQLEPEGLRCGLGDLLDGTDTHRRQGEWNTGLLRSARREDLAIGM